MKQPSPANKTKNIVSLVVDGVNSPDVGIGSEKANDANTNDPLYVGGNPGQSINRHFCESSQKIGGQFFAS